MEKDVVTKAVDLPLEDSPLLIQLDLFVDFLRQDFAQKSCKHVGDENTPEVSGLLGCSSLGNEDRSGDREVSEKLSTLENDVEDLRDHPKRYCSELVGCEAVETR